MLGGTARAPFKILVHRTNSKLGLPGTYETKYCLSSTIGVLWLGSQMFDSVKNANQIYALLCFLHNYPLCSKIRDYTVYTLTYLS
jgi:hypothetical protein